MNNSSEDKPEHILLNTLMLWQKRQIYDNKLNNTVSDYNTSTHHIGSEGWWHHQTWSTTTNYADGKGWGTDEFVNQLNGVLSPVNH